MLIEFLAERGLTLSKEKTLITHISEGFDFLGFNVRKYNDTLIIKPSPKSQKRFTEKLHEVVFEKNKAVAQQKLIEDLNPVLRGWGNYYSGVVSKTTFSKIDHILTNQLKRWSYRRHTNKSRKWIKDKYFIKVGNRDWIFGFRYKDCQNDAIFALMRLADIPIRRHVKVKCEANPYDQTWNAYFLKRKQKGKRTRTSRKGTLSETVYCKGAEEPI